MIKFKVKKIEKIDDIWKGEKGLIRIKILKLCEAKAMKMTELEKVLKIKRGTLRYHLNVLERFNLIKPMKRSEKEKGRPTYIKTNKEKIGKKYLKKEEENQKRKREEFEKEHKNTFLNILKKVKKFGEVDKLSIEELSLIPSLYSRNLLKDKIFITPEGEKFLKENSKK